MFLVAVFWLQILGTNGMVINKSGLYQSKTERAINSDNFEPIQSVKSNKSVKVENPLSNSIQINWDQIEGLIS